MEGLQHANRVRKPSRSPLGRHPDAGVPQQAGEVLGDPISFPHRLEGDTIHSIGQGLQNEAARLQTDNGARVGVGGEREDSPILLKYAAKNLPLISPGGLQSPRLMQVVFQRGSAQLCVPQAARCWLLSVLGRLACVMPLQCQGPCSTSWLVRTYSAQSIRPPAYQRCFTLLLLSRKSFSLLLVAEQISHQFNLYFFLSSSFLHLALLSISSLFDCSFILFEPQLRRCHTWTLLRLSNVEEFEISEVVLQPSSFSFSLFFSCRCCSRPGACTSSSVPLSISRCNSSLDLPFHRSSCPCGSISTSPLWGFALLHIWFSAFSCA